MGKTKDITIEDLVDLKIDAVRYLSEKGITCIARGEPVWDTLVEILIKQSVQLYFRLACHIR